MGPERIYREIMGSPDNGAYTHKTVSVPDVPGYRLSGLQFQWTSDDFDGTYLAITFAFTDVRHKCAREPDVAPGTYSSYGQPVGVGSQSLVFGSRAGATPPPIDWWLPEPLPEHAGARLWVWRRLGSGLTHVVGIYDRI